jgi:GAF domain-containing protein/HAMP domain-containing protein
VPLLLWVLIVVQDAVGNAPVIGNNLERGNHLNRNRNIFEYSLWLFALLPSILTVSDLVWNLKLYFTGIDPVTYRGGFIHLSSMVQGLLAPIVIWVNIGIASFSVIIFLIFNLVSKRLSETSVYRRFAGAWLVICLVSGVLISVGFLTGNLPLSIVIAGAIIAVPSGLINLGSFGFLKPEQSGSLQLRIITMVFVVVTPFIIGVYLFLAGRFSQVIEEEAYDQLSFIGSQYAQKIDLWFSDNLQLLQYTGAQFSTQSENADSTNSLLNVTIGLHPYIQYLAITDSGGRTIAQSGTGPSLYYGDQLWFQQIVLENEPAIITMPNSETGEPMLLIGYPMANVSTENGVILFTSNLQVVSNFLLDLNHEHTVVITVINESGQLITQILPDQQIFAWEESLTTPVLALQQERTGLMSYPGDDGALWHASLHKLSNGWGVIVQQSNRDLFGDLANIRAVSTSIVGVGVFFVFTFLLIMIQRPFQSIRSLINAGERFSRGDFSSRVVVSGNDEFSFLGIALNKMADQLKTFVTDLEQMVQERTKQLERKTKQLQAAAQVARNATAIRDDQELLNEAVNLISEMFGYYHVGIFILDEIGEYAILQAASSDGGQNMLRRGHKLRVGQSGIVGYVAGAGRARVAFDTGNDVVFLNNPDLPRTRSEISLPLKVSGKVIGVLDAQSMQPASFPKDDQEILQILADQIAIAIDSARSLQESRRAYQELNNLYGKQTLLTWQKRLQARSIAYRYDRMRVEPVEAAYHRIGIASGTLGHQMEVPISIRSQSLGSFILRREPDQPEWTEEDLTLAIDAVAQILPALENAQLLEEIDQKATLERLVSQISANIQRSLDLDDVMRTSVQELGQAIGVSRIRFRLSEDAAKFDLPDEEV